MTIIAIVLTTVVTAQSQVTVPQESHAISPVVEEFSFLIKDFRVDHQGQGNLNITIRYRYRSNLSLKDYPDFRWIAKDIENLLTNYPHETDYWEIVNKKITLMVLNKYSAVTVVTSQIEVSPSSDVPYLRSSIVTRRRSRAGK